MKKVVVAAWIIFYLVIIDISINIIFRYPRDPHNINPTFLQSYFEYGRSVEGKLAIMTRHSEEESAPRVSGGWLKSDRLASLPDKATKADEVLIALYGMSHTKGLWEAIQRIDEKFLIRGYMGAGAPPNWAYAAYELDKNKHKADVVILGIMTESVQIVTSTTGMTAYFDLSYPYTFPRYRVTDGNIIGTTPPFLDAKGYIEAFYDEIKWEKYRDWLKQNDKYYDPLLFKKSVLDNSAFIRLLRRAYSQKKYHEMSADIYNNSGFIVNSEEVITIRHLVKTFADSARRDKIIPIIYIVNTKGQGDNLFRVLEPVLTKEKIPYLSSHIICPPDDPRVFLSENSHFTLDKDIELAEEMISIIKREIKLR
jgi:hypothetical protein